MAAAPLASIPIAARSRFPVSTTIPERRPSVRGEEDADRSHKKTPQQAKTDPQAAPEAAAPATPCTVGTGRRSGSSPHSRRPCASCSGTARATRDRDGRRYAADTPAPAPPPAPPVSRLRRPRLPPLPRQRRAPPHRSRPRPGRVGSPVANSPLGLWLTEEKEGKVRIEQCGANLCGYSVDKKSNQNGEQVLINMKPGKDKWSGRIFDPNTGSTYDSTIALKGSDSLRVQGCAFGGVFCGGQTWTRVN